MERVKTLIKKLLQQIDSNAPVSNMLDTLQMLQYELLSNTSSEKKQSFERVSVLMPHLPVAGNQIFRNGKEGGRTPVDAPREDEKNSEINVNFHSETTDDEPEEQTSTPSKTANEFSPGYDPIEDIPTLAHQDAKDIQPNLVPDKFDYPEVRTARKEINDKLKEIKVELSDKLTDTPIRDLRKAIGVNDRYLFINELFRGDESMYNRSIKTIQNFTIFPEAEYWIRRELKVKLGWDTTSSLVKQFDSLVRRRFL